MSRVGPPIDMQPEKWQTVKELLAEVLMLGDSERSLFLDRAEITAETRREIESLLAFEKRSDSFMSLSAGGFAPELFAEEFEGFNAVGTQIGPYKVVSELGVGGMGAVYRAQRCDGKFDQTVAIKLLRREFNVSSLRAFFDSEIEIQSRLSHPNIAKIFDTGTTEDGIPYIVMEFVDGVAIDKFCAREKLNLKERLKLFAHVCESVAFLHQNLIIHRDLKPANILLTRDGTPKLLDFGVSKLLSDDASPTTSVGAMTPEYASPEQIKGEPVNTTSDIYSLGAILYKLLTGGHPFEANGGSNGNLLRAMIDDDPLRPSALTSSKFPNTNVPAAQLKGDIDNIVLKALSKAPDRRYQTADAFAADIWNYIDGLPVAARPATISYRASKFYRRNRIGVIGSVVILLSLIAGVAIAGWQASVARGQAAAAEDARRVAESETEKARAEQAKSEKVMRFMSKIIDYASPGWYAEGSKLKGQARVIEAVEDLRDKIDSEFAAEPDVAAELHNKFAAVFHWVSMDKPAEVREEYQKKRRYHALRGLQLRVQAYGEWHELVAEDLYSTYGMIGTTDRERADLLMRAINMIRDTNPKSVYLAYMIESFTAHMVLPETQPLHEAYLAAVLPQTGRNKYEIAEEMLRESLPIFRLRYKEDNNPIYAAECKLAYVLAIQEEWSEFDVHYAVCKGFAAAPLDDPGKKDLTRFIDLIELTLTEKGQPSR